MKKLLLLIGLVILLGAAWYFVSPLLIDEVVDEDLPEVGQVSEPMPSSAATEPTVEVQGQFVDGDSFHKGSGSATVYTLADGERIMRFEDFAVTNGPALHVYLVKSADGDVSSGYVDLGDLKGNQGNQNYEIPADVDLDQYQSVVIWCEPFRVTFATAELR